ncbi:hypothetical protein [Alteriqipengyuania lutimaris]|uniref:Aspartate-semialdehyde dehydrogenase n=1 Tax=Alteriqipengyuania lutimaris TaxID=1538146 RepID=A0A395LG40_9SPHN|nr:hypothetical protein [Alteriqipengyuania lutimaris]MBB3035169.1 hypothetical protein [Alteriqipengyuania lutimaris]RDS75782.1 hypothetical protein DL238_13865 [Alteriqipengyuania lutimaris]
MKARFGFAMIGMAALALAACGETAEDPATPTAEEIAAQTPNAPSNRPISLLADGLTIAPPEAGGDAVLLDFGEPQDMVVEELTMVFGGPQFGTNPDCPAGEITFATFDDFVAHFQEERFVGWSVSGPSERAEFSGPDGVTLGMSEETVRELGTYEAFEDSTLGKEFMLGEGEMSVSGLIEDGEVATLWGGTNCNFR